MATQSSVGRVLFSVPLALTLLSCGGNDTQYTPATTTTWPLAAAVASLAANGISAKAAISGSIGNKKISGSVLITEVTAAASAAQTALFNGIAAYQQKLAVAGSIVEGAGPATAYAGNAINYLDSTFRRIGSTGSLLSSAAEYDVARAKSVASFPLSVKIGDSGVIATLDSYTDSSMATKLGTIVLSYSVAADPTSTNNAIVEFDEQHYDAGMNATGAAQLYLRITSTGDLSLDRLLVQNATLDLTFTGQ